MFLVCGEALFDFFLEREQGPGQASYDARAGGSPFNVAIGLARLERSVGLLTGLSTDLLGQRLRQVLEAESVSTRYSVSTARPTTLSLVGLDTAGVPAYQFYDANSAGSGMTDVEVPEIGPEVTGFHFGSFSLVAEPAADAFASLARRHRDLFISLDPNIRPTVEPDMAVWRRRLAGLYPLANLVKISAEDLELLHPGRTAEDFAAESLANGVQLVIVTDGGEQARGWMTGGVSASATPPKSEVVDTVGAGDTFQAALLATLLRGPQGPAETLGAMDREGLAAMLAFAARAAAVTCTRRGADLPRASELV
ncbi:MAG: carbohydrate kinase [Rhodobacteraceae bacterium]|nr:carbohydrate kinase [Paracoccaceae bacterium]